VDLRTWIAEGNPAEVLIERSKEADLMVVGSRGHGGFRGMLLGSVGQHLVAHADYPVVVVR
jgi:nucleotide-binding universal stress UspA family protein